MRAACIKFCANCVCVYLANRYLGTKTVGIPIELKRMMKIALTLVLAAVFFHYTQALDTGAEHWNDIFGKINRVEKRYSFNEAVCIIQRMCKA